MTVDRTRAEAIVYEVLKEAHLTAMFDELAFAQTIVEALHRARMISHEKEPISHWRTITQEGEVIAGSEHKSVARYWQKNHPGENIVQRQWADKHSFEWRDEIAADAVPVSQPEREKEDPTAYAWGQVIRHPALAKVNFREHDSYLAGALARLDELVRIEKSVKEIKDEARKWIPAYGGTTTPSPPVSIADIQKVVADVEMVRQTHGFNPPATPESELVRRLWSLNEGSDPAVYVVRESDIAAVEVQSIDGGKWWLADGALVNMCESPNENEAREAVEEHLAAAAGAEAVARAIEAEQAVDPVEARALELFHLAYPGEYALTGSMETCRRIAEAEARQEADQ